MTAVAVVYVVLLAAIVLGIAASPTRTLTGPVFSLSVLGLLGSGLTLAIRALGAL